MPCLCSRFFKDHQSSQQGVSDLYTMQLPNPLWQTLWESVLGNCTETSSSNHLMLIECWSFEIFKKSREQYRRIFFSLLRKLTIYCHLLNFLRDFFIIDAFLFDTEHGRYCPILNSSQIGYCLNLSVFFSVTLFHVQDFIVS